ncbi:hypothetical protein ANCCAN_02549 [Ancylostoma caninum]|uniref:Uncharacterized protein n=1 Tax=Ancylostoma caninum TaxID=29170 RepID=A0A368H476_ANCCA|nr:hypothetical protein ANCCAN_02549 [Ancylostoma caninum]
MMLSLCGDEDVASWIVFMLVDGHDERRGGVDGITMMIESTVLKISCSVVAKRCHTIRSKRKTSRTALAAANI